MVRIADSVVALRCWIIHARESYTYDPRIGKPAQYEYPESNPTSSNPSEEIQYVLEDALLSGPFAATPIHTVEHLRERRTSTTGIQPFASRRQAIARAPHAD